MTAFGLVIVIFTAIGWALHSWAKQPKPVTFQAVPLLLSFYTVRPDAALSVSVDVTVSPSPGGPQAWVYVAGDPNTILVLSDHPEGSADSFSALPFKNVGPGQEQLFGLVTTLSSADRNRISRQSPL